MKPIRIAALFVASDGSAGDAVAVDDDDASGVSRDAVASVSSATCFVHCDDHGTSRRRSSLPLWFTVMVLSPSSRTHGNPDFANSVPRGVSVPPARETCPAAST